MPAARRLSTLVAALGAGTLACASASPGAGRPGSPAAREATSPAAEAGSGGAGAGAAVPAAGGGPVRLTFAWPQDLQARVTLDHREQRSGETGFARFTHRMVVAPEGRALRVATRESEAEGNTPGLELNLAINEALDQIVTRAGAYLRTDGLDEAVELLGARDDEARIASRVALERIAALDWELLAGAWAGRSLRPGEPAAHQFQASVPLLPGVPALLDVELRLVGRVPCEEGDAEPRCVELAWRGVPGPGARAAAVERIRGAQEPGAAPLELEDLRATIEARLVAEPETLLPHRLRVAEELRLTVRQPGGDAEEVVDRADDRYRFAREVEF